MLMSTMIPPVLSCCCTAALRPSHRAMGQKLNTSPRQRARTGSSETSAGAATPSANGRFPRFICSIMQASALTAGGGW